MVEFVEEFVIESVLDDPLPTEEMDSDRVSTAVL